MNARMLPASPQPPRSPKPRVLRSDHEFLPAALEILETPPSPVRVALLWVICILAVSALAWSYFGRIDIVAVAQGKVQPTGRVKVIQPLETGRVAHISVENGQYVRKGEVLVSFDSGELDADVNQLTADLASYRAEAARRRAAIVALADRAIEPIPAIEWQNDGAQDVTAEIKSREENVLRGDLGRLESTIENLDAQMSQKQRERDRFTATAAAVEDTITTLQQSVDIRTSLQTAGSGSKIELINASETLKERKTELATARGQMAESEAAAHVLSSQIEDSYRSFLADNLQKLADDERKIDQDSQLLAKAEVRRERTALKSPIDGTVSALSITNLGQVVVAGDEIMRIVPGSLGNANEGNTGIEIEAYVANRDIGFVKPGQQAVVKIESLPFTRYGTIDAKLLKVASDAIPEPDAVQREGNPAQTLRERGFAGAQRTQNLVFLATFQPEAAYLMADGAKIPLSPGMAVTVEIKTGSRRILEYLFSPLVEVTSEAMKER